MARTKEFDPDAVLRKAVDLFRRKGYEATSMADLVEHLGISRASLYSTFGGKHELYVRAHDRYVEEGVDFVGLLSQPGPVLPAVRSIVERYAEDAVTDRDGCLVVNSAVEMAPCDPVVGRRVEANWNLVETALTSALTRARAQGELSEDRSPRALARFLLVLLQGMRVAARGADDPARIRDAAREALAALG
ncbi:TetR/AcrR family transcriptional regulator [Nocardiopsis sp. EMB25]|uniref:TetR/AcrR family transcriptional regulator n=1 Tax=Nocardiopsis TaxID=2013 RepID=UPI00034B2A89|nr:MULTISPECIES: TetR/AcrR family transcriptional regulator [Nocardiopsis]MCY9784936.1 TetR/AcrR family transcriptional regulator [Nocardiopsis sp. EMB25]